MGLFSRSFTRDPAKALGRDTKDRDYRLTACPVITSDRMVVLVDVSVRLKVAPDWPFGYDEAEEPTIHAVVVMMLRFLGEETTADDLLVGRQHVVQTVEKAFALAPVASGIERRVTAVDVRRHDPAAPPMAHEFRVLG